MPEIALALSSDNRKTAWATRLRVVNYVAEKSSSNGITSINRIQRPGLAPYVTVGTGPIRGLLRQAGTFDGDLMAVSGDQLFRIDPSGIETLVGATPASPTTSPPRFPRPPPAPTPSPSGRRSGTQEFSSSTSA